jgi:L-ectoine synthase
MIIRTIGDIEGSDRDIRAETWSSRRLLLKADGLGFSLHDTVIHAGTETSLWYKHHVEACYCVEGTGEVESLEDGRRFAISPGVLYALDKHDRHILRAFTTMRLISVFNPPCSGSEMHDADGSYPPPTE